MLKVLGISGSPRKGGNSETLLAAALEGAREAGAACETVRLNGLSYRGCQACGACLKRTGRCALRDDLDDVYRKLREADIWVLSSPIYYDTVSGQMKLFFDRLRPFVRRKLPGRRAGLIIVAYEDVRRPDYARHARVFAGYLPWFGDFRPVRVLCGERLGGPTAASRRPDLLEKARAAGRTLAGALLKRRGAAGRRR
ncbi:MAG: flavodoxin family protein [Planctomycetota bacterium]|nr:flavodoxin family protein [Planctomycetota bacterium]